ncbi:hypothetical protein EMIT0P100_10240 [Pseudomonas sp. IT-P100]
MNAREWPMQSFTVVLMTMGYGQDRSLEWALLTGDWRLSTSHRLDINRCIRCPIDT